LLRFLTKHSQNLGKSVRTLKLLCWLRIRGIRTVISRFVLYLSGEQNLSLTIYLVMRIFFLFQVSVVATFIAQTKKLVLKYLHFIVES